MRRVVTGVGVVMFLAAPSAAQVCDPASPQLGLVDLGTGTYKTFIGGLYAGGTNIRPAAHEAAGAAIAESIEPLDAAGSPDPNGRIVLISIGYSNMTQEWASGAKFEPESRELTFTAKAERLRATGQINPKLLIVDGAQGGMSTEKWAMPVNPAQEPWHTALARLAAAGSSRFQVQVACMKVAHASPAQCMAEDGSSLGDAGQIAVNAAASARNLKQAFPNLKLLYVITRTYGGYALTQLNPEPFAYETGWGVKWLIEAQIDGSGTYGNLNWDPNGGAAAAAWMSWGPYLWAKGVEPNHLGICWAPEDFREDDRTHPASRGVDKAGTALVRFFMEDATTRPWFRGACAGPADFDDDCDVDIDDAGAFFACARGPSVPMGPGCDGKDLDGDGDGDQGDFGLWQRLLSEETVPAGPKCLEE